MRLSRAATLALLAAHCVACAAAAYVPGGVSPRRPALPLHARAAVAVASEAPVLDGGADAAAPPVLSDDAAASAAVPEAPAPELPPLPLPDFGPHVEIKGKVHLAPPHRARLPPPPALPSTFFTPAQVLNWFGLLFGLQSAVFLGVIWYIGISACEQVCSRTGWDEDRKFHDRLGKWWSWANLALGGCSPAIFGQDNLPAEGTGALFVSNHASWFDIPLVAQVRHARGAARHAARPPRARARRQRRAPPRSASLRLSSPRLLPPLILPLHPSRRSPTPTSSWRPTSSARCRSSRSS